MTAETYLNHPNFGLLYRISIIDETQELFTTLYAQRVFFLVNIEKGNVIFQPVCRNDAKLAVDSRLRHLRQNGNVSDYQALQTIHKDTF